MIKFLFFLAILLSNLSGKSQTYSIKKIRTHFKDEVGLGLKWRTDVQNVMAKGFIILNQKNNTITLTSTDGNLISSFDYNIAKAELDNKTGFYIIHSCVRNDISEKRPNGIPELYGLIINTLNLSTLKYVGVMSNDYDNGGYSLVMYYFVIQNAPF